MEEELLRIGLTEGEAKVYLALTRLGSTTVGPVVKDASVAYSNIYDILQRLIDKGVVSFIIKNKTKYFQAVSPKNLMDYLDKKEDEIRQQKETLGKLLPKLEKLQGRKSFQEAEVFLGKKGLKTAYERLLSDRKKGEEALFFYIHEKEYVKDSNLFYAAIKSWIREIPYRGISNEEYRSSLFVKMFLSFNMRFVSFPIPGNIDVYADKTLIISWKPDIAATLIYSQSIADNFRSYFNAVWRVAKK